MRRACESWGRVVMQIGRGALCAVFVVGCGHDPGSTDYTPTFLGRWECSGGDRDIDCGQGARYVALASGPPHGLQFVRGMDTDLVLLMPAEGLTPGSPGGPICQLGFDVFVDTALLQAESVCQDENGGSITVHEGRAISAWRPHALAVSTFSTTSENCKVETRAICLFR